MVYQRSIIVGMLACFLVNFAVADEARPFRFYHGLNYGSQAVYNPLAFIINSGYGILQYPNLSRDVFGIPYATGIRNVMRNLVDPLPAIREYGWSKFLSDEIYPGSLKRENGQYWSNYTNHLIGGGMNYVEACEWYRYHGFDNPKLLGLATIVVSHALNETVENGSYTGRNVDPIADVYVFNPLGIVFFSIDGVQEFFAQTLNMASWHAQPTLDFGTRTLENHGQNYSIKYPVPFARRISLFYYWGMNGLLGGSYRTNATDNVSVGAGMRAGRLYENPDHDLNARKMMADLTWNVGFFYDRNNSLLASLMLSGMDDYRIHANVYPGIIRLGRFSPGLFCAIGARREVISGLSVSVLPVGVATRLRR
jgi:hypothetical protein